MVLSRLVLFFMRVTVSEKIYGWRRSNDFSRFLVNIKRIFIIYFFVDVKKWALLFGVFYGFVTRLLRIRRVVMSKVCIIVWVYGRV